MADFVAVLKKTIDGLGETNPETRERVYSKARVTIAAKLAALNPPPPSAVAERQKKVLEDAIAAVETEYRAAEAQQPDPVEDLETAIAGLSIAEPRHAPHAAAPGHAPHAAEPGIDEPAPVENTAGEAATWSPDDEEMDPLGPAYVAPRRKRGMAAIAAGLVAVVVLGGAGYAAWTNKDQIAGLFAGAPETAATEPEAEPVVAAAPPAIAEPAAEPEPTAEPETEIAAVAPPEEGAEPEPEADPAAVVPDEVPVQKFTQRLRADGTEIDEGPAGGEPGIGEGTSLAAATVAAAPAPQSPPPLEAPEAAAEAAQASEGGVTTQPLVAVGQKAIFYEERTNVAEGSAEDGSIIWSLVQESPGGDLPPEPAIRAEATIPGKEIDLRMTIRRNGDPTLPASHIIEMIFLTPDDFEGGGIDNVLRIALKESEQAAGNPLLGIPAKIADGFFLVALTDSAAEIEANTTMLRRQNWIDIPIVYKSGRRALITLEKGVPGDRVFDEALKAWQAASSG